MRFPLHYIYILMALLIVLTTSCGMVKQINETKQFALCDFSIVEIKLIKLGNADVSEYRSANEVSLSDMLMLGQQFL